MTIETLKKSLLNGGNELSKLSPKFLEYFSEYSIKKERFLLVDCVENIVEFKGDRKKITLELLRLKEQSAAYVVDCFLKEHKKLVEKELSEIKG